MCRFYGIFGDYGWSCLQKSRKKIVSRNCLLSNFYLLRFFGQFREYFGRTKKDVQRKIYLHLLPNVLILDNCHQVMSFLARRTFRLIIILLVHSFLGNLGTLSFLKRSWVFWVCWFEGSAGFRGKGTSLIWSTNKRNLICFLIQLLVSYQSLWIFVGLTRILVISFNFKSKSENP